MVSAKYDKVLSPPANLLLCSFRTDFTYNQATSMNSAPLQAVTLPLAGRRILILRSREQASVLAKQLRALGATPILIPVLEIAPPADTNSLDSALNSLSNFDWLLFTSANAVRAVHKRLTERNREVTRSPRLAAIGPATAAALHETGLASLAAAPVLVPPVAVAESFSETLLREIALLPASQPTRCLLIRAEQARDLLPDRLLAAGAHVTIAAAYRNIIPETSVHALAALFSAPEAWPDAIPFTSSSTVTHLLELLSAAGLSLPPNIPRISIGPITSATLREHSLQPHAEAATASVAGLVEAIVLLLSRPSPSASRR